MAADETARRVRLLRDRLGIVAWHAGGHKTAKVRAGTVGEIRGCWVNDEGRVCPKVLHLRVDTRKGPAHLPVGGYEIEEVTDDR